LVPDSRDGENVLLEKSDNLVIFSVSIHSHLIILVIEAVSFRDVNDVTKSPNVKANTGTSDYLPIQKISAFYAIMGVHIEEKYVKSR